MENNTPENNAPEVTEVAAEEVVVSEVKPVAAEAPKEAPKDDIVLGGDKPKKKTGLILCMILL